MIFSFFGGSGATFKVIITQKSLGKNGFRIFLLSFRGKEQTQKNKKIRYSVFAPARL